MHDNRKNSGLGSPRRFVALGNLLIVLKNIVAGRSGTRSMPASQSDVDPIGEMHEYVGMMRRRMTL